MKTILVSMILILVSQFASAQTLPFSSECMKPYVEAAKQTQWQRTHDGIIMKGMDACEVKPVTEPFISEDSRSAVLQTFMYVCAILFVGMVTSRAIRSKNHKQLDQLRTSESELEASVEELQLKLKNKTGECARLDSTVSELRAQLDAQAPKTWDEWKTNLAQAKLFYGELIKELGDLQQIAVVKSDSTGNVPMHYPTHGEHS